MSVQPEHKADSRDIPDRAATISDSNDPAAWRALSCTTRSLRCSAGEIIVLQVKGEVDMGTLPILQAALGDSLDHHPAHLIVDLAGMTFCSAGGLDLLTQTRHTTADTATSYAVSTRLPSKTERRGLPDALFTRLCLLIAAVIVRHLRQRLSRPTTSPPTEVPPR